MIYIKPVRALVWSEPGLWVSQAPFSDEWMARMFGGKRRGAESIPGQDAFRVPAPTDSLGLSSGLSKDGCQERTENRTELFQNPDRAPC